MRIHRRRILTRSRGWMTLAVLCLAPVLFWALAHPLAERFATPASALKSLANIAALVGTAAFAVALVLGSRLRVVERLFVAPRRVLGPLPSTSPCSPSWPSWPSLAARCSGGF